MKIIMNLLIGNVMNEVEKELCQVIIENLTGSLKFVENYPAKGDEKWRALIEAYQFLLVSTLVKSWGGTDEEFSVCAKSFCSGFKKILLKMYEERNEYHD